jgi:DUF1680 family protein
VLQQETIEGHAVRAMLLCCGLVGAGNAAGRPDYVAEAQRLWNNMATRRMYVTGGVGSYSDEEKFGPDYYLPNKTAYAETCAAVAAGFFDQDLNLTFADAKYADGLERELFNGALAGVSVKGNTYFYENPLEADPSHRRWSWHGCPCCPPMFLKLMESLPGDIYAQNTDAIYINQFVGSHATVTLGGSTVNIRQTTRYPWDGGVKLTIDPEKTGSFDVFIRIPEWCQGTGSTNDLYQIVGRPDRGAVTILVNGGPVGPLEIDRGYARLHRAWTAGDKLEITFEMPARQVRAHGQIEDDRGRVALMRGPIVYCAESVDNPVGVQHLVVLPNTSFKTQYKPNLLGGIVVLQGEVAVCNAIDGKTFLSPANLEAVPFYVNANREPTAMQVWLASSQEDATPFTLANRSRASASHCWHLDSVEAIHDGIIPAKSSDTSVPRLSWWDHKGTQEWAQLEFPEKTEVSKVRVFWYADKPEHGGCDVPQHWEVLYQDGNEWKPVEQPTGSDPVPDQFNESNFKSVTTSALRIAVQLKPGWFGGISEWEVE